MAEEFDEGGVLCGGKWWNSSSTNLFRSSPCSLAINGIGWPRTHDAMMDVRSRRSSDDDSTYGGGGSASASDGSSSAAAPNNNNKNMAFDSSTLQTMDHWNNNQDLQQLNDSGRLEDQNYSNILIQEARDLDDSSMNYWQENGVVEFPQIHTNINNFIYTSSLLQTVFDDQPQQSLLLLDNNNQKFGDYSSTEFLPSNLPTASPHMVNPYFAKQQPTNNQLVPLNSEPLWKNGTAAASTQSQLLLPSSIHHHINKPNLPSFTSKHQNELQGKELGSVAAAKKASNEPALKRQRIQTPSPLPTFKVRKEKLGDRITALQQLVSPFGKTDTASVLHEAIEYIKFLHDQVTALSSPYLKYGSPPLQRLQGADINGNDEEGKIERDLKRRGLCLVPISSTFPVAAETTTDFWTPTFGPNFK